MLRLIFAGASPPSGDEPERRWLTAAGGGTRESGATPLFHRQRVHDAEDLEEVAFGFTPVAIPRFLLEQSEAGDHLAVEALVVPEAPRAVGGGHRVVEGQGVAHPPVGSVLVTGHDADEAVRVLRARRHSPAVFGCGQT